MVWSRAGEYWRRLACLAGVTFVALASCQSAGPKPGLFDVAGFQVESGLGAELRELGFLRETLSPQDAAWPAFGARAVALAAKWPDSAPAQRIADDFGRTSLRGPWVWAQREAALSTKLTAEASYLLGRLETPARAARLFDQAMDLAPQSVFGFHGAAWLATAGRDYRLAEAFGQKAAARASSIPEALIAGRGLAQSRSQADDHAGSRAVLHALGELPGLSPREVAGLRAAELASALQFPEESLVMRGGLSAGGVTSVEMRAVGGPGVERSAYLEALALLDAASALSDTDVPALVAAVEAADLQRGRAEKLTAVRLAVRGRTGARVVRLMEQLDLELEALSYGQLLAPGPSGLGLLDAEEWQAALALERGDAATWLATWRRRLPARLRGMVAEAGATRGQVFARPGILDLERDLGSDLDAAALVRAGWFEAAQVLALRAGLDADSDDVHVRAAAGQALATELARLCGEATRGELKGLTGEAGFLAAAARVATAFLPALGGEDQLVTAGAIASSPRESYGPLAALVQPGPRATARPDGAPLGGLAALMAKLGRVAVVGSQRGQLDATMRSVVGMQYLDGEHLGAPFTGTAFWCQGVDAPSRAEASGAGIAGAAVHDGFWIDIEAVRDVAEDWQAVADVYAPMLAARGALFPAAPSCAPGDAARAVPLLGEGRRLQLQLIQERGPATLDELLDLVQIHEEGHLCDRARFLPLAEHWPAALAFLAKVNFNPDKLIERLEYRAELTALAEAPDPRIVLVEILVLAESAEASLESGVTPHAAAYASLVRDLDALRAQSAPSAGYVRWQWHRIDAKTLHALALELARQEGLGSPQSSNRTKL